MTTATLLDFVPTDNVLAHLKSGPSTTRAMIPVFQAHWPEILSDEQEAIMVHGQTFLPVWTPHRVNFPSTKLIQTEVPSSMQQIDSAFSITTSFLPTSIDSNKPCLLLSFLSG
jgi:hypothetical protein